MSSVIRGLLLRIGYLFDSLYMAFNLRFQDSFDNLIDDRGIVPLLLSFLLVFEVLWVAIRCILQQNMSLPEILMKFFLVIITILFINNLDWFVDGIKTLFSTAGYTAADATSRNDPTAYGVGYIITPSAISSSALTCFAPIESVIQAINNYILYLQSSASDGGLFSGITGPVIAFLQCIPYYFFLICAYIVEIILLVVLSFALINISLWLIEFGLLLIIGTFCLPFQIFEPTKFLGKGVWPVLFGQGLKLFVIVYLVNLLDNHCHHILLPPHQGTINRTGTHHGYTDDGDRRIAFRDDDGRKVDWCRRSWNGSCCGSCHRRHRRNLRTHLRKSWQTKAGDDNNHSDNASGSQHEQA